MWRSKKLLVIALLTVVVLAGSIGGIVYAQTENSEDSQSTPRHEAMLDRVCEIYNEANPDAPIDSEALKAAFAQAGEEMKAEAQEKMAQAREAFRQKLIDEGEITQEQLDEWDTWLEAKPDIQFPFGLEGYGDMKQFGSPGKFPGFGGGPGGRHHPMCEPQDAPETTEE